MHLVVSPTAVTLCLPANFLYSLQLSNNSVHTAAGYSNEVKTARNERFLFLDLQENITASSERKATDIVLRNIHGICFRCIIIVTYRVMFKESKPINDRCELP